jgi:hypothetical protein
MSPLTRKLTLGIPNARTEIDARPFDVFRDADLHPASFRLSIPERKDFHVTGTTAGIRAHISTCESHEKEWERLFFACF